MRTKTLNVSTMELTKDPRLTDHWVKAEWTAVEKLPAFPKNKNQIAIVSYPDDEGVRLNGGRPGAADGPERILHYLGRMVHQLENTPPILIVSDWSRQGYLSKRHEEAEQRVLKLLQLNCRVITLGGGHDYGFPDASAYFQFCRGKILNIDAHLDLRPVIDGRLNSGTPFNRFIQKYGGQNLIEWGIQDQCNAVAHRAFAKKSGAKIFDYRAKLPKISGPVGLSLCLDAFAGIRGVSAPCFVGLSTEQGMQAIETYAARSRWLGIYECAPKLDTTSEDSARLAALSAYRFIHSL